MDAGLAWSHTVQGQDLFDTVVRFDTTQPEDIVCYHIGYLTLHHQILRHTIITGMDAAIFTHNFLKTTSLTYRLHFQQANYNLLFLSL